MNKRVPTDPEIIKEYLEVLKAVERETQIYNPLSVETLLNAVSIEKNRAYAILKRIAESGTGLRIIIKQENTSDPLKLDPYDRTENVEYIKIFDKARLRRHIDRLNLQRDNNDLVMTGNPKDDIEWPDGFKWKDENTFDLDGKGEIPFMAKGDNKTKTYFKMMTDAKTFVETKKMSEETKEDQAKVKIKLNQIRDKIRNLELLHLLALEARDNRSKPSAYRLVPYPKKT